MTTGFFVGRFQPLHNGHMAVIRRALKFVDKLIIGIGSAEDCYTTTNPFTTGERIEMLTKALKAEKINPSKYIIVPIRDIEKYGMWVSHVEMLCPTFEVVYTGSPITKMLFKRHKGYKIVDIKRLYKISATDVRKSMQKNGKWKKQVPKTVQKYLDNIDGIQRMKDIAIKDE